MCWHCWHLIYEAKKIKQKTSCKLSSGYIKNGYVEYFSPMFCCKCGLMKYDGPYKNYDIGQALNYPEITIKEVKEFNKQKIYKKE